MSKIALIVDDNSYIRKNIREILEEYKFTIYEAENGMDGVVNFEKYKPDIVIMDINMPILNGLKATEKILEIDSNANVLICSSMLFIPYYQKLATNAGARSLISKPFTRFEFIKSINYLLEKI